MMESLSFTGSGQTAVTLWNRLKPPTSYAMQVQLAFASRSVQCSELATSPQSHSTEVPQTPPHN